MEEKATLTPTEQKIIQAVNDALLADDKFNQKFPQARLVRIDSNRFLDGTQQGRVHLRFQHQGGMVEYWGAIGKHPKTDHKKGFVLVGFVAEPVSGDNDTDEENHSLH